MFDYVLAERSVDLMRLMVAESRRFPELMKKVANATFSRLLGSITHVFTVLAERKQIPEDDHAMTARLFADLMIGNMPIMIYAQWQNSTPFQADIDQKLDLFIKGRFGARVAATARTKLPARRKAAAGETVAD